MEKMIIVSNNALVWERMHKSEALQHTLLEVNGGVLEVLQRTRDLVHLGHRLLTHPLSGSVKPNQNPYKSIAISAKRGGYDFASVRLIEGSIEVAEKFYRNAPLPEWSEENKKDFQMIDATLLESALESLSNK